MHVDIFTDGSARGNPDGPGGYGTILRYVDPKGEVHEKELSQGYVKTTNNRMELMAAISALECLREPCIVDLYSDSRYVIDALEKGWAISWKKKGWVKSNKQPALNPDLWERLLDLVSRHEMNYHWVKGHADDSFNNRCDALAVAQRDQFSKK